VYTKATASASSHTDLVNTPQVDRPVWVLFSSVSLALPLATAPVDAHAQAALALLTESHTTQLATGMAPITAGPRTTVRPRLVSVPSACHPAPAIGTRSLLDLLRLTDPAHPTDMAQPIDTAHLTDMAQLTKAAALLDTAGPISTDQAALEAAVHSRLVSGNSACHPAPAIDIRSLLDLLRLTDLALIVMIATALIVTNRDQVPDMALRHSRVQALTAGGRGMRAGITR